MSDAQYQMGYDHGWKDGGDKTEEFEQDFAYKTASYVDGYWTGFKLARRTRLEMYRDMKQAQSQVKVWNGFLDQLMGRK